MSENFLKKHWYGLFNELKERWPELTQSDIDYISADIRKLVEVVQKREHISHAAAQDQVGDLLGRLQIHQRIA
jgi:phage terminase Nu1 subunit (DNA packaging protein)